MNDELERWSEWASVILSDDADGGASSPEAARARRLLEASSKGSELSALLKRLHADLEDGIESRTVNSNTIFKYARMTIVQESKRPYGPQNLVVRLVVIVLRFSRDFEASPPPPLSASKWQRGTNRQHQTSQVEQRIARTPAAMKLLSRLLKLDPVLCSSSTSEPLTACMSSLLPHLWVGEGHQAMRERCSAWTRERLHAATAGVGGERWGFGGSAGGEGLTMELLQDLGYSHSDMLRSIASEAVRDIASGLCFGPLAHIFAPLARHPNSCTTL